MNEVKMSGEEVQPKMKITYFKDNLEFVQDEASTPGMNLSFGKYNLGIKLNEDIRQTIEEIAKNTRRQIP